MSKEKEAVVSVKDLTLALYEGDVSNSKPSFNVEYGTFDIYPGDFLIVKGRNGCGKSTFLKLFRLQSVEYFKVVSGGIYFNDPAFPAKSIHRYNEGGIDYLSELRLATSFIDQKDSFISSSSAYSYIVDVCSRAIKYKMRHDGEAKNIHSFFEFRKKYKEKMDELGEVIERYFNDAHIKECFEGKDFDYFKTEKIARLSGGQQKMVSALAGIIKAEICGLRLLIMDEPLNNLDGKNKYVLSCIIDKLRKNNTELAIIVITHCQVFDGINKTLTIAEKTGTESGCQDKIAVFEVKNEIAHKECLENYK